MKIGGPSLIIVSAALASCGGTRDPEVKTSEFVIMSSAFGDGDEMPAEFTCDGDTISPPLRWANTPDGTKSFAVTISDLDGPTGTYRHWGAYNIPADRRYMKAGDGLPSSGSFSQVLNSKGERQYEPPCPPAGDKPHRYKIKVFALSKPMLELSEDTTVGGLESAASGSSLGEAEMTVTYARK